jgi:hypothetical protein
MTAPGGPSGQRAVALWRELFRVYRQRQVIPLPAAAPRVAATQEDLADTLLHIAAAFDDFIATSTMTAGLAEQSMLALLLVRDQLLPLPPRLAGSITADFQQILDLTRQARAEG